MGRLQKQNEPEDLPELFCLIELRGKSVGKKKE
jgi:hypothetical protein